MLVFLKSLSSLLLFLLLMWFLVFVFVFVPACVFVLEFVARMTSGREHVPRDRRTVENLPQCEP